MNYFSFFISILFLCSYFYMKISFFLFFLFFLFSWLLKIKIFYIFILSFLLVTNYFINLCDSCHNNNIINNNNFNNNNIINKKGSILQRSIDNKKFFIKKNFRWPWPFDLWCIIKGPILQRSIDNKIFFLKKYGNFSKFNRIYNFWTIYAPLSLVSLA